MPGRRLKPNPGQKVWQTAEIRAEIARWLPIPSKARFMRIDKTSFDTFLPSVWRSVGPVGFQALKAEIWAPPVCRIMCLVPQFPSIRPGCHIAPDNSNT